VAGRADGFLKISFGLAFLVAAGSVGYHYAVYIPTRNTQLDSERLLEKAHAEFARKTAQAAYETCVAQVEENYNAMWASSCKSLAETARSLFGRACGDAEPCGKIFDAGPNCSLPTAVASSNNSELNRGKDRCLQESQAGLQ
jgi:hypothetical protein